MRFEDEVKFAAASDEELVTLVKQGNTALFELLMRRNNQRVYRTARSILRDQSEAEDVMQHAYVRAWENLEQFRGESSF